MAYHDVSIEPVHLRHHIKLLDDVGLTIAMSEIDQMVITEEEWQARPESLSKSWSAHRSGGLVFAVRLVLPGGLCEVARTRALGADDRSSRSGSGSSPGV